MINTTLNEVTLNDLKNYLPSPINENLGNDMVITIMDSDSGSALIDHPFRFDGYMAALCIDGSFEIDINLKGYKVSENSMIVYVPGYLFQVKKPLSPKPGIKVALIAVSKSFITEMRYDFSRLYDEGTSVLDNPCISLDDNDFQNLKLYYNLILSLSRSESNGIREAMMNLMSSLFYFMGAAWSKVSEDRKSLVQHSEDKKSNKSKLLFEEFIKLVTEFHSSERTVGFYADKLSLTPKYLSKVIKTVSGRSAPDWIDSFVVLEAKNLLKYSDMSIKEVVYKLHFPSQSVFYKFFKSHTGMTPSEYRAS